MRGFVRFFTHNNVVPIAISFLLLGAASTYAATNSDAVISKHQEVVSVDNTYIVNKDIDHYSPKVRITGVTEDSENYYVAYTFKTIALQDSVWQDVTTDETLTVAKNRLGKYRDLGLYVTDQLNQKIQSELQRLKQTQAFEKKKVSHKQVVTIYSGLVGGFLDDKTETIPGYKPVVKPPKKPEETQTFARPDPNAPKKQPEQEILDTAASSTASTSSSTVDVVDTGFSSTSTATSTTASSTASSIDSSQNEAPELSILGNNPSIISVGDTYTDLGAVVTDDYDRDLDVTVLVDGILVDEVTLDTATTTRYTITYETTDSAGLTAHAVRTVLVQEKTDTSSHTNDDSGDDNSDETTGDTQATTTEGSASSTDATSNNNGTSTDSTASSTTNNTTDQDTASSSQPTTNTITQDSLGTSNSDSTQSTSSTTQSTDTSTTNTSSTDTTSGSNTATDQTPSQTGSTSGGNTPTTPSDTGNTASST